MTVENSGTFLFCFAKRPQTEYKLVDNLPLAACFPRLAMDIQRHQLTWEVTRSGLEGDAYSTEQHQVWSICMQPCRCGVKQTLE
jgi:hypothetical protein